MVGAIPFYLKSHSYGEYIFDWIWADASLRAGIPYYPKVVFQTPFTPCSASKILLNAEVMESIDRNNIVHFLIDEMNDWIRHHQSPSMHALFINSQEAQVFLEREWIIRHSFQYQWFNQNYSCFDDFLS